MKRFISLSILLFIMVSLVIPISYINNKNHNTNDVDIVEPVLSDVTYELVVKEVVEEQDPYEIAIQEIQEKMSEIESIEDRKEWFLAYKNIVFEYSEIIDPPETIYDCLTEEEVILICRVVETETYQCDFDSKVNVANVVFNRFECGEFGETIEEVITSKNQFAYGRKKIEEDTILAVEYAFQICDTTNGALFFHSNKKTDTFCGASYIFSDNAVHHFYK